MVGDSFGDDGDDGYVGGKEYVGLALTMLRAMLKMVMRVNADSEGSDCRRRVVLAALAFCSLRIR